MCLEPGRLGGKRLLVNRDRETLRNALPRGLREFSQRVGSGKFEVLDKNRRELSDDFALIFFADERC